MTGILRTKKLILRTGGEIRKIRVFCPKSEPGWIGCSEMTGFIDAFREVDEREEQYTWWSNRGQAWANNTGWRIDYHVATPGLGKKTMRADIYKDERFSDHAPLNVGIRFLMSVVSEQVSDIDGLPWVAGINHFGFCYSWVFLRAFPCISFFPGLSLWLREAGVEAICSYFFLAGQRWVIPLSLFGRRWSTNCHCLFLSGHVRASSRMAASFTDCGHFVDCVDGDERPAAESVGHGAGGCGVGVYCGYPGYCH